MIFFFLLHIAFFIVREPMATTSRKVELGVGESAFEVDGFELRQALEASDFLRDLLLRPYIK